MFAWRVAVLIFVLSVPLMALGVTAPMPLNRDGQLTFGIGHRLAPSIALRGPRS